LSKITTEPIGRITSGIMRMPKGRIFQEVGAGPGEECWEEEEEWKHGMLGGVEAWNVSTHRRRKLRIEKE
jgi:hypothetical protein